MNIAKHMEAVFIAALAFAGAASVAALSLPQAQAHTAQVASIGTPAAMPVVVVSAKRMTDAEKRASLQAERKAGSAA